MNTKLSINSNITVITSTFPAGYVSSGKAVFETWEKYFSTEFNFKIYHEGMVPCTKLPNLELISFEDTLQDCIKFRQDSEIYLNEHVLTTNAKHYKNCVLGCRLAAKVFTIYHAYKHNTSRYMLWLDHDVYALKKISKDFILSLIDNQNMISTLSEFTKNKSHPETGLILFDTCYPQIDKFMESYITEYKNLNIYKHKYPWDHWWMGELLTSYPWIDLCTTNGIRDGNSTDVPKLRDYFFHDLGKEKWKRK
jgi:hypothetical protein